MRMLQASDTAFAAFIPKADKGIQRKLSKILFTNYYFRSKIRKNGFIREIKRIDKAEVKRISLHLHRIMLYYKHLKIDGGVYNGTSVGKFST